MATKDCQTSAAHLLCHMGARLITHPFCFNEATKCSVSMSVQGPAAPDASWSAKRVASDLALSKDLMLKLDVEKGIESNALAPQTAQKPPEAGTLLLLISLLNGCFLSVLVGAWRRSSTPVHDLQLIRANSRWCRFLRAELIEPFAAGAEAAAEPDSVKAEAEGDESRPAQATEQAAAEEQPAHAPNGVPSEEAVKAESAPADSGPADAAAVPEEAPKSYDEQLGQLDLQLTYLWRVHGVDYYAGVEHAEPEAYDACAGSKRVLRCPRPEEGEQPIKEEGDLMNAPFLSSFSLPLRSVPSQKCVMVC